MTSVSTTKLFEPYFVEKLNRVLELKRIGLGTLYDRVAILVDVFLDADYRQRLRLVAKGAVDDFRVATMLDQYVDDTGLDFLELREVYVAYPNRDDWVQRGIRQLVEVVRQGRNQRRKESPQKTIDAPVQPRPTRRAFREIQQKAEAMNQKCKAIEAQALEAMNTVASLREQLARVTAERDAALARVAELEAEVLALRSSQWTGQEVACARVEKPTSPSCRVWGKEG